MEGVGFLLKAIKTEQFATFPEFYSKKKNVGLTTNLEYKVSTENKQVGVFATFAFDQTKKVFLKIQVSCHFEISADAWSKFLTESKIVLPKDFMTHIAILTIGTARGVLHSRTEGTQFNQYILPTLDIRGLISKDVEFELN